MSRIFVTNIAWETDGLENPDNLPKSVQLYLNTKGMSDPEIGKWVEEHVGQTWLIKHMIIFVDGRRIVDYSHDFLWWRKGPMQHDFSLMDSTLWHF